MKFLSINIDSNQKYSYEYLGEDILCFNEKCEVLLTSNFYKNIFKNNDEKMIAVLTKIELKLQKCIKLNLLRLFSLDKGIYRSANLILTNINANKSSLLIILRELKTILRDHSTTLRYLKTISQYLLATERYHKMILRYQMVINRYHKMILRLHLTTNIYLKTIE